MSEQTKDGGPAFPCPETGVEYYDEKMKVAGCRVYPASVGMSLRDWFAGQALAGILTSDEKSEMGLSDVVESAFEIADAMLERRGK